MLGRNHSSSVLLVFIVLGAAVTIDTYSFAQSEKAQDPERVRFETRQLIQALLRHDPGAAQVRLQALIDYRRSHLIPNLSDVASAFLFALSRAASGLSSEARLSLSQQAIMLAPDFPPLYFNLARAYLANDGWAIGPAFRAIADGVWAYGRNLPVFFLRIGNMSLRLSIAFVLFFAIFSVFTFLRHSRLFYHDLRDLLPAREVAFSSEGTGTNVRKLSGIVLSWLFDLFGCVLVAVLFLLPFLVELGIVCSFLFSLLLVAPYVKRRELIAGVFACAVLLTVGPLAMLTEIPQTLSQSHGFILWRCLYERCSEDELSRLPQDDPMFPVASSLIALQKSPEDEEVVADAFSKLALASPDDPLSLGIKGNAGILLALLRCSDGVPDRDALKEAVFAFERILQKQGNNEAALRGLAVSWSLLKDHSRAEEMFQKIVQVTRERDLSFLPKIKTVMARQDVCANVDGVASFLEIPKGETSQIYARAASYRDLSGVIPKQHFLFGNLRLHALPFLVFLVILLLPLINRFARRRSLARVCPRCGGLTCKTCSILATGFDYCPRCIEEQVRSAFAGSRDIAMTSDMRAYSVNILKRYVRTATAFLPGAKQILDGRTATGFVMALVFALSASYVMFAQDLYDGTYLAQGGRELSWFPPVVLVLVFVWSVVDGFVRGEH